MNRNISIIAFCLLSVCTGTINAQYKWENPANQDMNVIRGQAFQNELKGTYVRLPDRSQEKVRKPVWDLSRNSTGMSVVFRSNAPEIRVRYVVNGEHSMSHMPATGVSGVDLYATDANGRQRWCRGYYAFGDTVSYTYKGLTYETNPQKGYEYQLFLPLYNTVKWMSIGVPVKNSFRFLPVSQEQPIVIYGTSIAQGACASRAGMAWANVVNRVMEHSVVNLGFSGNGKLEPELFDLLAEIDAKLYIIDCMPNLPGHPRCEVIYDRTLAGVKQLREKSQAPILLVEHSGYTNEFSSQSTKISYEVANVELRKAYNALIEKGVKDIYYLTKEEIGLSMDSMVEGVHPSDLGMQQYADSYIKKLREILHEETGNVSTCIPCKQQRDPYDWNERHEQVLALNSSNHPEILMIGNSITHYWSGEPISKTQQGKNSWDNLFKGKVTRNLGFGWDKIENVLWRIYHGELDGYQAKKIFVMLGTNNLQSNTDQEIIEGINLVIKAIQKRQPQAKLHIVGIYPRKGMETRIKDFNAQLKKNLNRQVVTYIDLGSLLTNKKGRIIPVLFSGDGLHPKKEGYEVIAKGLEKYMN